MNGWKTAALGALLAGAALLGYGLATGQARVGLLLIIPMVTATGLAPTLGVLLVMGAGVLWFVGATRDAAARGAWAEEAAGGRALSRDIPPEEPRRARSGGVVLLGPIPIVWGSDRRVLPWMVAAGLALLVLALALAWSLR